MKFKKILTFSAAALMLASVGAGISNTQASASNYMGSYERRAIYSRRVYVRRPIKLQKMSGSVFATMRATGHKWLHKGEKIGVVPFYHMGHDGYVVHIPGYSDVYYASTNSHNWYGKKTYRNKKESTFNPLKEYSNGHKRISKRQVAEFRRTNSKYQLRKSKCIVDTRPAFYSISNKYTPYDKRARIPKWFNLNKKTQYPLIWTTNTGKTRKEFSYNSKNHHWSLDDEWNI